LIYAYLALTFKFLHCYPFNLSRD